jgi:hypothetical protein
MVGWGLTMAGFTGHAICFPGGCGRIIASDMANETSAWLALFSPIFYENRIISSVAVWPAHPTGLKFCMAGRAVERLPLGLWTAFLCLNYY